MRSEVIRCAVLINSTKLYVPTSRVGDLSILDWDDLLCGSDKIRVTAAPIVNLYALLAQSPLGHIEEIDWGQASSTVH